MSTNRTIVINNGSDTSKIGFAGDSIIVCKPSINYPIERGLIKDWNEIEELWTNIFNSQLKVNPEDYAVLLTETALNPIENREKTIEIMFEKMNVSKLFLTLESVLSLIGSGHTTGVVLDCGHGVTQAVPIFEGHAISDGISRVELAGADVNEYLKCMLYEAGFESSLRIAKELKEKLCRVSLDYEKEILKEKYYKLPDGYRVSIRDNEYKCPELLFKPSLRDIESCGVHKILLNSIIQSNRLIRSDLYSNIILSGGTTMLHGFSRRIDQEIYLETNNRINFKIFSLPERKNLTWIGVEAVYLPRCPHLMIN